jgi:hypothetical protein
VQAAAVLDAYLGVFTEHYLDAKHHRPVDLANAAHQRLSHSLTPREGSQASSA